MRNTCHDILKTYFYQDLIHQREALCLTQSQMAERLLMDDRSYIDLDHGRSCCSAVTLALYLAFLCEDAPHFIDGLRQAFEEAFQ